MCFLLFLRDLFGEVGKERCSVVVGLFKFRHIPKKIQASAKTTFNKLCSEDKAMLLKVV
jgi:hypothetical protein